ncbi:MAG TPA: hypothetical protein VMR18_00525 [Candidatus Saccharimonadales bacterium]|nr:hypothetical protein [Candidatus Saccharimonadales bacterium]
MPEDKGRGQSPSVKALREAHLANVYDDPEFINDLVSLPYRYKKQYPLLRRLKLKAVDTNLYKPKELEDKTVEGIAVKYRIKPNEVVHYARGLHKTSPKDFYPYEIKQQDNNSLTVQIKDDITKAEFTQIWEIVKNRKAENHNNKLYKKRLPQSTKLLYAIFKVREHRLKKLRYKDIQYLLEQNELPYFEGGHTRLHVGVRGDASNKIARYYNRHKPDKIKSK